MTATSSSTDSAPGVRLANICNPAATKEHTLRYQDCVREWRSRGTGSNQQGLVQRPNQFMYHDQAMLPRLQDEEQEQEQELRQAK
jgi:hypothetical protein